MAIRYRVYCDGLLCHDSFLTDPTMHLEEPKLKMGDNSAGSFEFIAPPGNPAYDQATRMLSTLVVMQDDSIIWSGRIISESEDFWKRRKFVCEGALAYLNDTHTDISINTSYNSRNTFIRHLINEHNNKVQVKQNNVRLPSWNRAISINEITISEIADAEDVDRDFYETNNETVYDWFQNNVVDKLGAHIRIVYGNDSTPYLPVPKLDIQQEYLTASGQEINFGDNLLDFTKNWDLSNLVTVILPRGKQLEEDDETDTSGPKTDTIPNDGLTHYLSVKYAILSKTAKNTTPVTYDYTYYDDIYVYNTTAYAKYGHVEKVVDFSDCDNPTTLLRLAKNYISSFQFDEMVLEVSALDLKTIDNNIRSFRLLEQVRCISKPHGLEKYFPLTAIEIDLANPANNKYTLGLSGNTSLSGAGASSGRKLAAKMNALPAVSKILDLAKYNASEILTNYSISGYVNVIQESKTSQALVISDTEEWTQATKLWKWDMNGLGFSDSTVAREGYSGYTLAGNTRWYKTAITRDGKIVADMVSTGILSDGGQTNNYWNLDTGEFMLSAMIDSNSTVVSTDGSGNKTTISTVEDISNKADSAADFVDGFESGSQQLLDSTDTFEGWRRSVKDKWTISDGIATCSKPTATTYTKTYLLSRPARAKTASKPAYEPLKLTDITGKKLVLSFDIKTDESWGELTDDNKVFTYIAVEDDTGCMISRTDSVEFVVKSSWARKIIKYTIPNSYAQAFKNINTNYNGPYEKWTTRIVGSYKSGSSDLYISVRFYNRSRHSISIRKIKLERGTVASDWSTSSYDQSTATTAGTKAYVDSIYDQTKEAYEDAITKQAKKLTNEQVQAIGAWSNQEKIFKRLTSNGNKVGIWIQKPRESTDGKYHMYINASYIQTGKLNANLIKTGIITNTTNTKDYEKSNKAFWFNLNTGYIKAKNMELTNMHATGTMTTGSTAKVKMINGNINFYLNNKLKGRLAFMSSITGGCTGGYTQSYDINPTTGRQTKAFGKSGGFLGGNRVQPAPGVYLSTLGRIYISSDDLFIQDKGQIGTSGTYFRTVNDTIRFRYVMGVYHPDNNSGYHVQVQSAVGMMRFINGLLVDVNMTEETESHNLHV